MSSLLMSPSETLLISVTVFPISNISVSFYLRASIILPTLPICSWMLHTFSIKTFNIWIIFILNLQPDNSKFCVISESDYDDCFLSSDCGMRFSLVVVVVGFGLWFFCVLPFGMSYNFMSKA